jgi:diguanylate cyclase (GGDEF)-like protein/PAS domain S-box-containing protein
MTDRTELLEAALDSRPDGIALLGVEGEVVFWNHAAEAITGFESADLQKQAIPRELEPLLPDAALHGELSPDGEMRLTPGHEAGHAELIQARHKLGQPILVMARTMVLRDAMGWRIGTAIVFHPAESLDALPHGETGEDEDVESSLAGQAERLQTEFEDFERNYLPLGVLWVSVDQAQGLRKTHGLGACKAMLEKVERALAQGLRPSEKLGRWGDDEFLIIAHERTPEMLAAHAQVLAGLARTADFRWWGDRISLTVSIGAAQADHSREETLAQLLERAQEAMFSSIDAGGNRITPAAGR